MTQSTEQERAEFEAWYIAGARKAVPAFAEWSEIEICEGCMRPDSGSYRIDSARIAWDAWQAARRAQAVPQEPPFWFPHLRDRADGVKGHYSIARRHPDKEHLEFVCPKGNWVGYGAKVFTLEGSQEWMKSTMLSAAPQPPEATVKDSLTVEAAPVQMPEQIIRDFMHLIDDWSEKDFAAAEARLDPWSEHDPASPMQMLEKLDNEARDARHAIEVKLRQLLADHGIQEQST